MKDHLIASILCDRNVRSDTDKWREVQELLIRSKEMQNTDLAQSEGIHENWHFAQNLAVCEIMIDGNYIYKRKSPPDVVSNVNKLLEEAKAESDKNNTFFDEIYPIHEWRDVQNSSSTNYLVL